MEPENHERFVEQWLDAALRQRGAAEPRPGLESRVLATVRAERDRLPAHTWSWWPVLVTLGAMVLMGAAVSLRRTPEKVGPSSFTRNLGNPLASKPPEGSVVRSAAVVRQFHAGALRGVSAVPRLEQFPSPLPLSAQEKILARYVQQFPQEAVLVAQAQTQLSKQERIEQETSALPEQNP